MLRAVDGSYAPYKPSELLTVRILSTRRACISLTSGHRVVSKTKHSKTKTEARSTQISKTKHPKLENEAPKKFTGKTSDQRKCSRSALTDAYVDKRVAGKMGSTNHEYQYRPTSAGEKSNAPWDGLVELWRCGRIYCPHLVWLALCKT